jgi:hypothetical protein
MRYTYPTPTQLDLGALDASVRVLSLPGFAGLSTGEDGLHAEFPGAPALSAADKVRLDNAIAAYVYLAPPPPPDVVGLLRALRNSHKDLLAKIVIDPHGAQLLPSLTFGDMAYLQELYNDMKVAPPAGMVLADVQTIGTAIVAFHIPLTP